MQGLGDSWGGGGCPFGAPKSRAKTVQKLLHDGAACGLGCVFDVHLNVYMRLQVEPTLAHMDVHACMYMYVCSYVRRNLPPTIGTPHRPSASREITSMGPCRPSLQFLGD